MKKHFIHKAGKILPLVKSVLTDIPACRDNDAKLMWNVWFKQLPNIKERSVEEIAALHIKGKLGSWESITRCRRKLQEEYPHLRGDKYEKRHQEEVFTRQNIKTLFD